MNAPCNICHAPTVAHATATVRNKFPARFLRCPDCGFISVENPTWLAEAYAEPINRSDTGYVARNLWAREQVRRMIETFLDPAGTFLDYAAGYGLFVRLMRDAGHDFRWADLYCQNLFARGFEAAGPLTGPFAAVTAFEVFEHLPDPNAEMKKLAALTDCLIFSTRLVPEPAPQPDGWWYFGLEHGQHIAFYTRKSLERLAAQHGYQLTTDGGELHIFSRRPVAPDFFSCQYEPWWRFWKRPKRPANRTPLTQTDHDDIVKKIRAGVETEAA
jgi:hypothetical protein